MTPCYDQRKVQPVHRMNLHTIETIFLILAINRKILTRLFFCFPFFCFFRFPFFCFFVCLFVLKQKKNHPRRRQTKRPAVSWADTMQLASAEAIAHMGGEDDWAIVSMSGWSAAALVRRRLEKRLFFFVIVVITDTCQGRGGFS